MTENARLLVDSSVAVKWFIVEEDTDKAVDLQNRFLRGEIELFIPDLALFEISNALLFSKAFTKDQIQEYLAAFLELDVGVLPFNINYLSKAIGLAADRGLAIYDAYFVACAAANGLKYITADRRAAKRLADLSYVVTL